MSITAEVLADSLAPCGKRLTTVLLDGFPKFLQAELNTHRMLSRGSASSRAIPNEKLRQRITEDPAMPVWWGKQQPGMQAREELGEREKNAAMYLWRHARDKMLEVSADLANLGVHKQLCNRLIEPWMPVAIIVSATEWENFFRLRCHPDAQPEMRVAAEAIRDAMVASEPSVIQQSGYHLPLVRPEDYASDIDLNGLVKLSVARCARASRTSTTTACATRRPTSTSTTASSRAVTGVRMSTRPARSRRLSASATSSVGDSTVRTWIRTSSADA